MKRFVLISILVFFAFLVPSKEMTFAEGGIAWDPEVPVCTASGNQENIRMAPDGSGGAIVVWQDYRSGVDFDIYAQRIDQNGNRRWQPNGVIVSTAPNSQLRPVIVGDGYGGAIIAWEDYRNLNADIYALRISSAGEPYLGWLPGGMPVSASTTEIEQYPDIVVVGTAEVVVVWQHKTGPLDYSIRGQKMNGFGATQWGGGVIISSGTAPKESAKIINDGMGCLIVTWQEYVSGTYDIYAYRMDINNGTKDPSWLLNGNPVSIVTTSDQKGPEIVPDGFGGAIITWTDFRDGNGDIYAQRISSAGVQVWTPDGIPVCKMDGEQSNPAITNSLLGGTTDGAIIAWEDRRDPYGYGDIYAVKVSPYGGYDLTQGGVPIATGGATQMCPRLVNDSQGGGIGAWIEKDLPGEDKIFATKRGEYGVPLWNIYPGVLVYEGSDIKNHEIVNDNAGGIIVAWQAIGVSGNYDIFAQRVVDAPFKYSASISGRVTLSDGETGITGVEVWALRGEELVSSAISDTNGYYKIIGLAPEIKYLVRANWSANGIESSVSKEAFAPSYSFNFTLEKDYLLGTIAGNVSGVGREAKRVSVSGFKNSLSSGNGTAFVELEQRGKVIVRVPLEIDGNYSIPNLLPGRFVARAYNGSIYSNSRMVQLKEGETLRVDFAFGIIPEETVYNHPNPAKNGLTTIRYYCGYSDPEAEIKIYNINGELVREVKDSEIDKTRASKNIYSFLWDCKNNSGKEIASGIYIYAVEVKEKGGNGSKKVMKRMAVIR